MSQKVNYNIRPKNGYLFKEADGTTITGKSWSGVIARVRAYRIRNKIPFGNPDNEVRTQACQNNPEICSGAGPVEQQARQVASLKSRVLGWFAGIRLKMDRVTFVDAAEQKQRAGICAQCPRKTDYPGGCASCIKAVETLRKEVIGSRAVDARLDGRGCAALGEDVSTSSWLDEQRLENPELPANCWRKRGV